MLLTLATSKEALALGRELTNQELGEILGRNDNKQNYSGLTSHNLQLIFSGNNLRYAGTITYGTPQELLNHVKIDVSFFTQLKIENSITINSASGITISGLGNMQA